jgi:hypothetical protein
MFKGIGRRMITVKILPWIGGLTQGAIQKLLSVEAERGAGQAADVRTAVGAGVLLNRSGNR